MTRARKKPRGFYAQYARNNGMSLNAAHRKFNPDKRPCVRAKHECDAGPPWDEDELVKMDRAFCAAMEREIARGSERPRSSTLNHVAETAKPTRPALTSRPARSAPRPRRFARALATRDRPTGSGVLT